LSPCSSERAYLISFLRHSKQIKYLVQNRGTAPFNGTFFSTYSEAWNYKTTERQRKGDKERIYKEVKKRNVNTRVVRKIRFSMNFHNEKHVYWR
jgi:hypothetical protein